MNFNSTNVQGMRPQSQKQQLPMAGQSQFRQQPMPKNIHGNMTSSGLPNAMNLQQRSNAMPQNIRGNLMSSYGQPNSVNSNFQQGGGVMPQNLTSFRPVPNLSQMPQNIPANNMTMTSSKPPNSVNLIQQNFQQGDMVKPQNVQANNVVTASRPPNSVNLIHHNFHQGGLMVTPQNIQANNVTSSAVNLSRHNFQQQPNMMQRNEGNFQQNQQPCVQQRMPNLHQNQICQQNNQPPVSQQLPAVTSPQQNNLSNLQQNQISQPSPQVVEQVSQPVEQQNNMLNMQQQPGSDSLDLQEKTYQRILCMRDMYLVELNEVLVKFSNYLQTGNQESLRKRLDFKKALEYLVRVLQMNKSEVIRRCHQLPLDVVEKKIVQILSTRRPSVKTSVASSGLENEVDAPASADYSPQPQLPQLPQIINLDEDGEADHDDINESNFQASLPQPQLPQTRIVDVCSDHPPVSLEIEEHGEANSTPIDDLIMNLLKEAVDDMSAFSLPQPQHDPNQTQATDSDQAVNLEVARNVVEFERLRKALETMPRASVMDEVGDIAGAIRIMADSVSVGPDYFATTLSGTKRMRRSQLF